MKKKILSMALSVVMIGTAFLQISAFADSSLDIYTVNGAEYISLEAIKELGVNIERQGDGDVMADYEGDNVKISKEDTLKKNNNIYIPMKETLEVLDFTFDFDGSKWTIKNDYISKNYLVEVSEKSSTKSKREEASKKPIINKKPVKIANNKGHVIGYIYPQYASALQQLINKYGNELEDVEHDGDIRINDPVKITDEKGNAMGYVYPQYVQTLQQLINKYGSEFKLYNLNEDKNAENDPKPLNPIIKQPQIIEVSLDDLKVEMSDISQIAFKFARAYYIDMSVLNKLNIGFITDDEEKIVGITNQLNNKENKDIICNKQILDIEGSRFIEVIDNLKELDVDLQYQDDTFIITNGDMEITVPIYDLR